MVGVHPILVQALIPKERRLRHSHDRVEVARSLRHWAHRARHEAPSRPRVERPRPPFVVIAQLVSPSLSLAEGWTMTIGSSRIHCTRPSCIVATTSAVPYCHPRSSCACVKVDVPAQIDTQSPTRFVQSIEGSSFLSSETMPNPAPIAAFHHAEERASLPPQGFLATRACVS